MIIFKVIFSTCAEEKGEYSVITSGVRKQEKKKKSSDNRVINRFHFRCFVQCIGFIVRLFDFHT